MPVSFRQDIKSVSDLKKKTSEIFKQVQETGRPIVITVNGKPHSILLDVDVFEKKLRAFNLAVLLAEGEEDIRHGNVESADAFMKELKKRAKLQG
ncbi:MAG: type II toxin-antitoxin system Phd/YefM family antitoxin [Syntrophorhabdales bacterium]